MLQSPISHPAHAGRGADQSEAVAEPLFCRRAACHDTGRLTTASGSRGQARRLEELRSKRRALIPVSQPMGSQAGLRPSSLGDFLHRPIMFLGALSNVPRPVGSGSTDSEPHVDGGRRWLGWWHEPPPTPMNTTSRAQMRMALLTDKLTDLGAADKNRLDPEHNSANSAANQARFKSVKWLITSNSFSCMRHSACLIDTTSQSAL